MNNFLIYKSSAGSGKTYTLVKEYLKIVLKNPEDFKHTLAVTFTNKAAEEMKNRILEKLIDLSNDSDKMLIQDLESEIKGIDVRSQAAKVLENILHRYSYFSIFTIDSFFYRIIKSFARELKLHLSNDLELDEDIVLDKITDELLDKAGIDKALTDYLENFIYYYVDEDKGWKIDTLIKEIGSEIFKERYWEKKNKLKKDLADNRERMKEFIGTIFSILNKFESKMFKLSDEANAIVKKFNLEIYDFPYAEKGAINYLLNKLNAKAFEPAARVRDAYEDKRRIIPKIFKGKTVSGEILRLHQILVEAVDLHDKNILAYNSAVQLTKTIYVLGIFNDLLNELRKFRDDKKLILISDMNNILQKVISKEASPFVYEKMGNAYSHYLIDEFQDTSTFQWNNMLPLIINSLSENNFSMVVGDVKQSIYRWRNGNMKLLLEKIYMDLLDYKETTSEQHLIENWRSSREIVEFNNSFFQKAVEILSNRTDDGELIKNAYSDCVQKSLKGKEGGYINITFIDRVDEDELTTAEKAKNKLLEYIKELLEQKYSLRDILVLVRKNEEGTEIAKFLNDNNISVVSSESLLITNSPKIKLLINLLKYISDNKNDLAKTEIIFNFDYLNDLHTAYQNIFNDHKNSNQPLFHNLLPQDFFKKDEESSKVDFGRLNPALNNLTLYELIEHLIGIFNLKSIPDAYLQRFQDMILEYLKENNADVESFLPWWEENKQKYSIILPQQEDAVRIMTIHKAKGLQSKIVIIPYANWGMDLNGSMDLIWVSNDKQYPFDQSAFIVKAVQALKSTYFQDDFNEEFILTNLDNLNLMYVAFTRAIDRLYVIVPEKGSSGYNVSKVITEAIKKDEEFLKGYNELFNVYERGAKTKKSKIEKDDFIKTQKLKNYISTEWTKRVVIRPRHENLKLVKEKDFSDKITSGVTLHKILSYVKTKDDMEFALQSALNEGLITSSDIENIRKAIEQFISLDATRLWFSGEWLVKSEAEILLQDGKVLRPDRVMLKNNEAIVVDYKTGKQKKEHEQQLNEYALVLSDMGYKTINKYLVYTEKPEVIKI
jgi:ATP-dependent exoDNAse (exonuclease V) beta subunit